MGGGPDDRRRVRSFAGDGLLLLVLLASSWGAAVLAARWAAPALVNLGPNDLDYISGFREGWERDADGLTRFHWTLGSSIVRLPLHAVGSGHRLRLRLRRHLVEPSDVTLRIEGQIVAQLVARAYDRQPYYHLDVPLPVLNGRSPFALLIESRSTATNPLGVALDWVELVRASPSATFRLRPRTPLALAVVVGATFLLLRSSGASSTVAMAAAILALAAGALGLYFDVVAAERILRLGAIAYAASGALAVALVRWRRVRKWLQVEGGVTAVLVAIVLVALAVRLVLILHPQFYYPDVRIHAQFAQALASRGLPEFLRHFTEDQFRYSLGLQFERGHWYAFPYPPAFYLLCWPLVRFLGYRSDVAVSVLPAVVNSLEAIVVYAIGRRLGLGARVSVAGAAVLPLLPIFLARLTLAYFPALVGHAVDAVVILYLAARLRDLHRPRVVLVLGGLVGLALLTYTQSLLNFGVLLSALLVVQLALDREERWVQRAIGLAAVGFIGGLLSLSFYARYIPIFLDMRHGTPMPEEAVLLDKLQHLPPAQRTASPEPPDDPFAGPGVDLVRGFQKAAWRLYVFYSLFAPVAVAGIVLVMRRVSGGSAARLVAAWAITYVLLNLASGGLPGPNLVRYNKDMEVIAPLCCLALGSIGIWLFDRARVLGAAFALAWTGFGSARAVRYLSEKFVLER